MSHFATWISNLSTTAIIWWFGTTAILGFFTGGLLTSVFGHRLDKRKIKSYDVYCWVNRK